MNMPTIHKLTRIDIPQVHQTNINDVLCFWQGGLTQPFVKVDVTFEAGDAYAANPLISAMTCNMLVEGTKSLSSKDFSERLDFLGAEIFTSTTFETSTVVLACINKHATEAIKLLADCLTEPRFDANEFEILKQNLHKKFLIDLENVSVVARRTFLKHILKGHPYGNILELNHFNETEPEQLRQHFYRLYNSNMAQMYVAGYVDDSFMQTLKTHLRFNSFRTEKKEIPELPKNEPQQIFVEKSNAVQNAIRIGKLIIGRDHPDFIPLSVAVTVLGGYFGSRLMKTLREEKGYTYGIYSFIYSHRKLNTMVITTEVASEYTADALKSIYNEIDDLCQHKISDDELDNVKSYLMGQLIRSIDGPLSSMDTFKSLRTNGADFQYLDRFVNELQNITPEIILTMAQRYLSDGYSEIVVGKKN